jgi:hypothetical protein
MSNNFIVYVHINKTNGKRYYGITSQKPEARWHNGKGYVGNHFVNAINKYGWDGFDHIIIARGLTEEEAKWLEIEMIAAHNTTNPEFGYNLSPGGDMVSNNTRQKISSTLKGKYCGRYANVTKPLICLTTKRIFFTTREAARYYNINSTGVSSCCTGRYLYTGEYNNQPLVFRFIKWNHNRRFRLNNVDIRNYNKDYVSLAITKIERKQEENKLKRLEKIKGLNHPSAKPVICITTKHMFFTAAEAAKFYNIKSKSNINLCCKGKYKSAGKLNGQSLKWKYLIYNHNKTYRVA